MQGRMRRIGGAAQRLALSAALVGGLGVGAAGWTPPALAEERPSAESGAPSRSLDQGDALQRLFAMARSKEGDPHLPFVLNRLKRAIAAHDMVAFLDLIDPAHFDAQFKRLLKPGGSPGDALGEYSCTFLSVCDLSKSYSFNDVVSAHVLAVAPEGGLTGGLVEVALELTLWDGLQIVSTIYYNPSNARLSAAFG